METFIVLKVSILFLAFSLCIGTLRLYLTHNARKYFAEPRKKCACGCIIN